MKKLYFFPMAFSIFNLILIISAINSFSQNANPATPHAVSLDPWLKPFYHGVASGDPMPDKVIIWTRVTPDSGSVGAITVNWRMASDTNFAQIVNSGTVSTDASIDYTVNVDVTGLQPKMVYYYEFSALGRNSLIGRTKTTPVGDVDSLRFAIVSCANYEAGFFNAYSAIKKGNDVDAVIMLGDYIYEYETGGYGLNTTADRTWKPDSEIISLSDYRTRYSHYHLDKDLRQLHQQYPWIIVWDDHETANDSWEAGAQNHNPATEGDWFTRKDAGIEAHQEWLPIRSFPNDTHRIYRTIPYGNLLDLIMLDTRLEGRDAKVTGTTLFGYPVVDVTDPALTDTSRKIISDKQFQWLVDKLDTSAAQWKMLGNQVMVGPLKYKPLPFPPTTYIVNADQWDGFPAQRQRLFDNILTKNIDNVVVVTGDIHTSWANDLPFVPGVPYDSTTGAGSAGVEFVGTSVTSPGLPIPLTSTLVKSNNPNIHYVEFNKKGYVIMDVTKLRTQGDYYYIATIDSVNNSSSFETSWYVKNGERFLRNGGTKSVGSTTLTGIPFAPEMPRFPLGIKESLKPLVVLGTYPNPFVDYSVVQFYNEKNSDVTINVVDVTGKVVSTDFFENVTPGLHIHGIDLKNTSEGSYFLSIQTKDYTVTRKLVKGK